MWLTALLPLVVACTVEEPVPRNCADRVAFYPDTDGDGLGEPTEVYVGCDAPDGWVTELGTTPTTPTDTASTSTSTTGDTGTE
ncbi:MAG: hypothetical protein H6738_02175 [Alphaproteobacteria bacterium]|nr:hypothetical protein [Alphaproteobacteria bacterium]MCB9695576.1 hypothetical protein [Alphaproteobacteria bacterium]